MGAEPEDPTAQDLVGWTVLLAFHFEFRTYAQDKIDQYLRWIRSEALEVQRHQSELRIYLDHPVRDVERLSRVISEYEGRGATLLKDATAENPVSTAPDPFSPAAFKALDEDADFKWWAAQREFDSLAESNTPMEVLSAEAERQERAELKCDPKGSSLTVSGLPMCGMMRTLPSTPKRVAEHAGLRVSSAGGGTQSDRMEDVLASSTLACDLGFVDESACAIRSSPVVGLACSHSEVRVSGMQPDVSIDVSMRINTTLQPFSNDRSSMLSAATIVSPMDIEGQLDDEQRSMSMSKSTAVYDSKNPLCNGPVRNITGPAHQYRAGASDDPCSQTQ